jgi:hypothetical protein
VHSHLHRKISEYGIVPYHSCLNDLRSHAKLLRRQPTQTSMAAAVKNILGESLTALDAITWQLSSGRWRSEAKEGQRKQRARGGGGYYKSPEKEVPPPLTSRRPSKIPTSPVLSGPLSQSCDPNVSRGYRKSTTSFFSLFYRKVAGRSDGQNMNPLSPWLRSKRVCVRDLTQRQYCQRASRATI